MYTLTLTLAETYAVALGLNALSNTSEDDVPAVDTVWTKVWEALAGE